MGRPYYYCFKCKGYADQHEPGCPYGKEKQMPGKEMTQAAYVPDLHEMEPMAVSGPTKLGVNPKDLLGAKRVSLHLVPPASFVWEAIAMTEGALKYGPYNWRSKAVLATVYISAALRHIEKWLDREDRDPTTRVKHLANAKACLGILLDAEETGNLADDRPPAGYAGRLLAEGEEMVRHLQSLFPTPATPK